MKMKMGRGIIVYNVTLTILTFYGIYHFTTKLTECNDSCYPHESTYQRGKCYCNESSKIFGLPERRAPAP